MQEIVPELDLGRWMNNEKYSYDRERNISIGVLLLIILTAKATKHE